ncbi:hypothetical protein AB4Z34_31675 [Ensifer sp. 2YAB10]|uniref:hypothetical protein n=1 Tax=unclassified Ensifer TaxID=2633371 RepID=UPI003F8FB7C9
MPRTGGVYSPPAGTKGVPNTTIQSVPYNTLIDDLTADANTPRPLTAGGTGATSASGARTALGLEIGTNVQAQDAGLQSIAGLTTTTNQMLYTTGTDLYATAALTPFARTILDDVDAATMRATIGADNASNLTSGTVNDARLPSTMSSKTFLGGLRAVTGTAGDGYINMSAGNAVSTGYLDFRKGDDIRVGYIGFAPSAGGAITLNAEAGFYYNFSGALPTIGGQGIWNAGNFNPATKANLSGATFGGAITTPSFAVDNNGDRSIIFRTATGTMRGMVRHDQASDAVVISTFGTSGTWNRDLILGGANAHLVWGGSEFRMGGARYLNDGNIYMPWAGAWLHEALSSKITTDGRAYPRRVGGVDLNFNWSGQGGQPSWLWGGNDGTNMYVYNPSNFNVSYAANAGNALGHGQGWQNVTGSRAINSSYQNTTGRPIAVTTYIVASGGVDVNLVVSSDNSTWAIVSSGIYDATSGGPSRNMGNGGFTIIPSGWYYKVLTNGGASVVNWQELRT